MAHDQREPSRATGATSFPLRSGMVAGLYDAFVIAMVILSVTFAEADARTAGLLRAVTEPIRRALPSPRRTLSHGDHACLALAARLGLPVVTADRDWALYAEAAGAEVRTIR
jgi:hypothetical protein